MSRLPPLGREKTKAKPCTSLDLDPAEDKTTTNIYTCSEFEPEYLDLLKRTLTLQTEAIVRIASTPGSCIHAHSAPSSYLSISHS
jgi:hypothetical protein